MDDQGTGIPRQSAEGRPHRSKRGIAARLLERLAAIRMS
jgi:hypothetical protein